MKNWQKIAVTIYALGALITFGHSAATGDNENRAEMAACRVRQGTNPHTVCMSSAPAWVKGTFGSMLWPLYWSWTVFEHDNGEK